VLHTSVLEQINIITITIHTAVSGVSWLGRLVTTREVAVRSLVLTQTLAKGVAWVEESGGDVNFEYFFFNLQKK